jgi:hypothetical protein
VQKYKTLIFVALFVAMGMPLVVAHPVFADDGNIKLITDFIRDAIKIIAGVSGLVATAYFVVGGFMYITSSGNPEKLDRAKNTLKWSAFGLFIVMAAFPLTNIILDLLNKYFKG